MNGFALSGIALGYLGAGAGVGWFVGGGIGAAVGAIVGFILMVVHIARATKTDAGGDDTDAS